jgi:hypothetical protein
MAHNVSTKKHKMLTDELLTFHVSRKCTIAMLALQSSNVCHLISKYDEQKGMFSVELKTMPKYTFLFLSS